MVKFANIHNGEVSFSVQIFLKMKKLSWYEIDFFFQENGINTTFTLSFSLRQIGTRQFMKVWTNLWNCIWMVFKVLGTILSEKLFLKSMY